MAEVYGTPMIASPVVDLVSALLIWTTDKTRYLRGGFLGEFASPMRVSNRWRIISGLRSAAAERADIADRKEVVCILAKAEVAAVEFACDEKGVALRK